MCSVIIMDISVWYSTASEALKDVYRKASSGIHLDDSQTSYSMQVSVPSLDTVELSVIHNRPCKHSSKLQPVYSIHTQSLS